MRLWQLANRNLRQRALTSALTTLSILLGTGIVAFLWLVAHQAEKRYVTSSRGYSCILGPSESSALDLVLSTIYMIKPSQGVIPLSVYRELYVPADDPRQNREWGRFVRCAVPLAFGDSYRGFPVVATTDDWFLRFGGMTEEEGRPPELRFAAGRPFVFGHAALLAEAAFQAHLREGGDHGGHDHGDSHEIPAAWKEVVVGALVARQLDLRLGSTLVPAHGVGATLHHHDEAECRVVGILEPLGTPIDRAIYLPLGAFYRLKEHAAIGSESKRAEDVEISAIVLNTRPPMGHLRVWRAFQRRPDAIASLPQDEIRRLFTVVGNIALALRAISFLVLIVGAIGVFIALYTTMNERRRDVAIMRSLGARRLQIFGIVLLEALLITVAGAVLGVLGAHLIAFGLADWLLDRTGVPMTGAAFALEEVWLILGVSVLGACAGLLPALQASRTDVAHYLGPDR